MAKRKVAVGDQTPGAVEDAVPAANSQNLAQEAISAAAASGMPGFPQTEAELEKLRVKVEAQIEALIARLPEGFRPNPAQIQQIIDVAVANFRNRVTGTIAADLMTLATTGKGPFRHDPAALA